MPNMDWLGWIVVGFLAGALSSATVKRGGPEGCVGNTVVGILGGLLGGWFATEELHWGSTSGFLGALVVAFLGAVALRLILNALEGDSRGRR
ncbi:MAG: GlsB/YeaQ/YmgE family stress response membrane protein [Candidatus Limnocylindrales bacterium]